MCLASQFALRYYSPARRSCPRRGYMFCLVTAGLACLFQPVGMVLGVFTFLVHLRPSVKILFGRGDALTPRSSG
jgi:hypothetical protein